MVILKTIVVVRGRFFAAYRKMFSFISSLQSTEERVPVLWHNLTTFSTMISVQGVFLLAANFVSSWGYGVDKYGNWKIQMIWMEVMLEYWRYVYRLHYIRWCISSKCYWHLQIKASLPYLSKIHTLLQRRMYSLCPVVARVSIFRVFVELSYYDSYPCFVGEPLVEYMINHSTRRVSIIGILWSSAESTLIMWLCLECWRQDLVIGWRRNRTIRT